MSVQNYYVIENGSQVGPFSLDEMKSKNINANSLIWHEGLEKWSKAANVPELQNLLIKPPPPPETDQENVNVPSPIPSQLKVNQVKNYKLASVGQRFGGFVIMGVIELALFLLIIFLGFGGEVDDILNDLTKSEGFFLDVLYAGIDTGIIGGIFYSFFSGNLGHKLLGLKVIHVHTGKPVNSFFYGFSREFGKGIFISFIIPVIWLLFDKRKQNLYDKINKTLVVKSNK